MLKAEVTLPGAASSVPTARRFVESLLSAWGHPELGWTAAVCISELAGNAALHTRTTFSLSVSMSRDTQVRLEVRDGSARVPVMRNYGTDATTGRGLRMINELASSWGVDADDGGKVIWLLLDAAAPGGSRDREAADETDLDAVLATLADPGAPSVAGLSPGVEARSSFRFAA